MPAAAFSEDEKVYAVTAELPGVEPGGIDVTVSGRLLAINGENRHEKEEKKKNYHFCERSYGSFRRVFALPENVDQEKIAASFANGVLTVILPKGKEVEKSQRKIEVKTQATQAV